MERDFRDIPRFDGLKVSVVILAFAAVCMLGGYIVVGLWNRAVEEDPSRVTGFERPN